MKQQQSREVKEFNRLYKELDDIYHEISVKAGLSDSTFLILYALADFGSGCLQKDIADSYSVSRQTINSAIRKLEREGILYLETAGPKTQNVCLTDAGKQLAEQTAVQIIQIENEIFASWTQTDVQKYLELTEAFLLDLQEKSKNLLEMKGMENHEKSR